MSDDHQAALLEEEDRQDLHQAPQRAVKNETIGWIAMVVTITCYSFVIPLTASLQAQGFILKVMWRFFCCIIGVTPFALLARKTNGKRWSLREILCAKEVIPAQLAGLSLMLWLAMLLYSAMLYSFMISEIFSNLAPIYVVAYRSYMGKPVGKYEIVGLAVTLLGSLLTLIDPEEDDGQGIGIIVWSITIAIVSSVFWAGYLLLNEKCTEILPPDVILFGGAVSSTVILAIVTLIFEDSQISFDPKVGIFGVLAWENVPSGLLLTIIGLCAMKAVIIALKHLGSLVVSVACLAAPLMLGISSWLLAVDHFPAYEAWISTAIMSIGLYLVIRGQHEREK